MAQLTTTTALHQLLNSEDTLPTWLKAGYTKPQRQQFRLRLERGMLTQDKMDEILQKCGYTIAVEKQWKRPER